MSANPQMSKNILLAVDAAGHDPGRHVSAAADMTAETSITFSILRAANAFRSAAASAGFVQLTPLDFSR